MDLLFIGGTGNISTDCAALLSQQGHTITLLSRGQREVPEAYRQIVADRRDADAVRKGLGNKTFDAVLNFIGFDVGDIATDLELYYGRTDQYVFISTTVVYAKPPAQLPITEEAPLGNRFSAYGRKKQACEEALRQAYRKNGFPITIVRPSHTYSPRWIPNPVTSVGYTTAARLEQGKPVFIHDDGQGLWTLTSSRDFAVGFAGLVGNDHAIGETFQITSDEVLTWNEIVWETCQALGVDQPELEHIPTDFISRVAPIMHDKLKGDKAHPGVFDCAKIKRAVPEFSCTTTFRQGIRQAVAWFKADPQRQQVDPQIDAIFDKVIAAWRKV